MLFQSNGWYWSWKINGEDSQNVFNDDLTFRAPVHQTPYKDENIVIGHSQNSETDSTQFASYYSEPDRRKVTLVDTLGFNDSGEEVTDVDVLRNICSFLDVE